LITRVVAGSSLALCPPLIINEQQVDEIIEKMRLALDEALAFAMKQRLLDAA
jgi:adenosylmethionine-8-amino-7-oxononanoate aminotransferase